MDEKFIKLVEFSEKTFKTDVEIEPLHKLLEEIEQHEVDYFYVIYYYSKNIFLLIFLYF